MKSNRTRSVFFAIILCTGLFSGFCSYGQSTYMQVYNIFQAKCFGCHNSTTTSGLLNLTADPATVYAALVNHNPVNPAALNKGDKRIAPGDPHRSYLLRKINNGLDADNGLATNNSEGAVMPQYPNPPMSNYEIELVRQWILMAAPQTGLVVDTALLTAFYSGAGINSIPTPLAPPSSNGFRVHLAKIFLAPHSEKEIFIKYNPKLADTIEVNRIQLSASPLGSHHIVIYKFYTGQDIAFPEGLRDTNLTSHGSANFLAVFSPITDDHVLPPGTAYQVEKSAILDLNYHMANYSDSVLGVELYFNIYTQPKGTAQKFMYNKFFPITSIVIPPHDTTTFTQIAADSSETNFWEIWIMYTHTHKYGTNYDVWLRNDDGTKGEQVYNGFYDFTYSYIQGFYGTGIHGAEEHFSPFLEVNPMKGFIHTASFYNFGMDTVYWGLTNNDEMMVMGFEYTYGPLTGINNITKENSSVKIYPNPFNSTSTIMMKETNSANATNTFILSDILGREVKRATLLPNSSGEYRATINRDNLPAGLYIYEVKGSDREVIAKGKVMVE